VLGAIQYEEIAIAYALAGAGIAVTLVEMNEAGIGRARANIEALIAQCVKRGLVRAAAGEVIVTGLRYAIGYANLPPADLAIEAAFEDMAVKRTIFAALEAALPATAILATNTSYLDVNQLAAGLADPGRALGLHFFSPAHIMKLLEIVRAVQTSA
jgi:3-hydroxyacyl-CoA dehydrogenase